MNNQQQLMIDKNNSQNNSFFTKKRIITFSILFLITIGLLVGTIVGILKINFIVVFSDIGTTLQQYNIAILFLLLLIFYPVIKAFNNIFYFYLVIRKWKIKIRKRDWFTLSFIVFFIIFITPSSLGSEPFYIYWLNKKIFDVKKSSAIVLANSAIGELSTIIVTIPSFVYFCTQYNIITLKPEGVAVFWFSIVGLSMDCIVMFGLIVLIFSKKTHYFFSICFHKIKKFLNLKYKSKQEIISETIGDAVFKKEVNKVLKLYSCTFFGFVWSVIYNVLLYVYMYFSIGLIMDISSVDFLSVFNYMNVGVTANNFIPLPGSEGSLQMILQAMLANVFDPHKDTINESIFIWRFFTTQLPAVIGLIFLCTYIWKSIIIYKNKKINNNMEKSKELLFIFDENEFLLSSAKVNKYFKLLRESTDNLKVHILNYELAALTFSKGPSYLYKRNKYLKQTNDFNSQEFTVLNYLKFLKNKKKLILYNSKILKNYLKTKNYELIIDFSFFGLKIFAGHKNYFWVQNRKYDEIRGKIFLNSFDNFFGPWFKKIIFSFDPFYYIYNVVVTIDNDKNIGNNDNFIYINDMSEKKVQKLLASPR